MTRFFSLIIVSFLAFGCGGNTTQSPGEPGAEDPTAGGSHAGDSSDPVSSDDPAEDPGSPSAGTPCEAEIAIVCEEGMVDGCSIAHEEGALTSVHICVPASERASHTCEQEIERMCPDGLVNACSLDPAPSSMQICVVAP